jgi:hypothetical protein
MLLAYLVQSINIGIMRGIVFHIIVRRVNQVAQIILRWDIFCQYVGDCRK